MIAMNVILKGVFYLHDFIMICGVMCHELMNKEQAWLYNVEWWGVCMTRVSELIHHKLIKNGETYGGG